MANFLALQSTTQTSATGQNIAAIPIYNNEIYDDGGNYDSTTGVFTASSSGTYLFQASVKLGNLIANNTLGAFYMDVNLGLYYRFGESNAGLTRDNQNTLVYNGGMTVKLNAGDTVRMRMSVAGNSSNNVSILGDLTYFSGKQL